MNKIILKLWLPGLLVAAIAGMPNQLRAQDTNKPAAEKKQTHQKKSGLPFHGKLKAVDNTAKTISVGELTLQITSETKISKAGSPAMLSDGVVGEPVSGSYRQADNGLAATTVHFGAKEGKEPSKKDDTKHEQ